MFSGGNGADSTRWPTSDGDPVQSRGGATGTGVAGAAVPGSACALPVAGGGSGSPGRAGEPCSSEASFAGGGAFGGGSAGSEQAGGSGGGGYAGGGGGAGAVGHTPVESAEPAAGLAAEPAGRQATAADRSAPVAGPEAPGAEPTRGRTGTSASRSRPMLTAAVAEVAVVPSV